RRRGVGARGDGRTPDLRRVRAGAASRARLLALRRAGRASLHLRRALRLYLPREGGLRGKYRHDPGSRGSRAAGRGGALVDAGAVDGGWRDAELEGAPASVPSSDSAPRFAPPELLGVRG